MEPLQATALMKFLARTANEVEAGMHVYVVGGAVRNHLMGYDVKDLDLVVDSIRLGHTSEWFAQKVCEKIRLECGLVNLTYNQYGVAILSISAPWLLDERFEMKGVTIEIANARKESYSGVGGKGKGYKPTDVQPATIEDDLFRREFTFNTLLWRLGDLTNGPEGVEVLDLTGRGLIDLREAVIRTPLDPDRTFADDPTRMLRAIKFHLKYGMAFSHAVAQSIHTNADTLKQMPWEASGAILVRDVFADPRKIADAYIILDNFRLLPVLQEMVRDIPPFATYLNGQYPARDTDVKALLYLTEMKLVSRPLGFLSEEQREELRKIAENSTPEEVNAYFAKLLDPPIENLPLIEEFGLEGAERKQILTFAREAILANLALAWNASALREEVRSRLAKDRS